MGSLSLLERELGVQVVREHRHRLHCFEKSSVDRLLVGLALCKPFLVDGSVVVGGEELLLATLGLFVRSDAGEIRVVDVSGDSHGAHVDLGRSGDDVCLVDAAKRNAVYLVGTCKIKSQQNVLIWFALRCSSKIS